MPSFVLFGHPGKGVYIFLTGTRRWWKDVHTLTAGEGRKLDLPFDSGQGAVCGSGKDLPRRQG